MTQYAITTQHELRAYFWKIHIECERRPGSQNKQPADTRAAWVTYIDYLQKSGQISEALVERATL